ncbi:MAG: hypothetical protein ACP5OK_00875 [Thermoprotei archaeon]
MQQSKFQDCPLSNAVVNGLSVASSIVANATIFGAQYETCFVA